MEMKKILVADNHPLMLKYMTNLLEKRGHEVLTAQDGLSALDILNDFIPDIMFIDLIMPNIDGKKLCKIVRRMPALKHSYIVVLSAIAAEELEETANLAEIEADAYIAKGPFDKMGKHILAILNRSDQKASTGHPGEIIGLEDIHSRQITKELLSARRHSKGIMENIDEGIMEIACDARIVYVNSAAVSLSGISEEKLLASNFVNIFHEIQRQELRALLESNKPSLQVFTKDSPALLNGKELELRILPLKEEGRKSIVILKDVTEEKKRDVQIQRALKMETIGTLAGGIAHEFNNLLTGIQGNASLMLLNTVSADPDYKRLKNIEKMVQDGSTLTSQLLGYAREGKYQVRSINPNKLVENTSDTFGRTRKDIAVHKELAGDLFMVEADQGQIEQVLLNLYVNAADAMPGVGSLFLKTTNVTYKDIGTEHHRPKPGNYVKLVVTDTGNGMEEKTRKRIFDPFFTTKEIGQGTGLGLASAYGIIKAHGGYIDVESEKGKGSSFKIYLPAVKAVVRDQGTVIREEHLMGHKTILLVDDEESVREVSQELLETIGYNILTAKDGKEALEVYKKYRDTIDLVLLDMVMPNMGGSKVYDRLKEMNPGVKVLLSSGYSINGEATEIVARGCNGFIQKPFSFKDLSQEIKKILNNGQ
ncbi:MAG: response regulator [Deltaproteobacteria bacterium]|nr:response regulator [Deltaproteobacteria bacterium]MBW2080432.1 response regulator [Deltaproteobacteria bacterium]MBW2349989.1 response regulator [Deltaproteobacteria bacterium]